MNYKSFNLGDWIGHISGVIEDETTLDGNEMLDLVEFLSTLKQEPCDDAVSRKAVLNTLDFTDKFLDETRTVESYKTLLEECYKNLPSVTPIHKDRTVQDFVDKCRECGKQKWRVNNY